MSDRDESHSSLYLLNKKLVDLNKVVSIVEYNRVSLVNGIDTIKDRYYHELTNIFNDHANMMQNILDELQNTRNGTEEEIKNQYKGSFEVLQLQLRSIHDSFKDELLSNLVHINTEIENINESVNKIYNEFENEIKVLNNYDQEGFKNMINNAHEKIKSELLLLDDESKTKYNTLIENNKQRLNSLDETFQKAVIDLKKKFFMTSKNQNFFEYIDSFQSNSAQLFIFLDETRNMIFRIQNEHKKALLNYKTQIKAIFDEIIYLEQKFQNEIQESAKNNESEINKFSDFLSQIKSIQISEQERLNERFDKFKNNCIKEIDSFHDEFDKKNRLFNSTTNKSNDQIEELNNQLISDFQTLKQKYENEENEIKIRLDSLVFIPEKDEDDYFFRLKELKKMHSDEINFFNNQNQNDILNENNRFLEEKSTIQNLIDLNCQFKQIKENFQIELKKFDVETENFLMDFKNQLENEQINEKNKLDEENNLYLSEHELKINNLKEENRQQKFNRITELENQRLSIMTNLKHEFQTDKVIDNFISKYHDEYSKINDEFINFDDTLSKSKLTKDGIEREKEKLKETEKKNSDEKEELLKKWQYEINIENDRHQNFLINNKLQSDDENNDKLNNELTDIRLFYLKKFKEKDNFYSELQIKLNGLQNFEISRDTPDLDEKIKNLKKELFDLASESNEKIKLEEIKNRGQFISPLLAKIQDQQEKNFQNLQIEKRKIEIEITELAKNVNDYQSHLTEVIYNGNKSINREILAFQLNEQSMKNNHIKNVDNLTDEIIEAKKELNEIFNSNLNEKISQIEKKFLMVQNATFTQNKKEIDKLINTKNSIEKDYNLILKKMKAKFLEIRNLYSTRETRPEEQKIIDRLEGTLDLKSQTLTASVKDMMSYRSHLQAQEDLYNTRFGNSPKIGIATMKQRAASQMAKNLPPL